MRSFRRAAIAGATALAVSFAGVSVASAEEAATDAKVYGKEEMRGGAGSSETSLSTVIGRELEKDRPADFHGLVGSDSKQPLWAQIAFIGSILGVVGSIVGLVLQPALAFAKANGLIK